MSWGGHNEQNNRNPRYSVGAYGPGVREQTCLDVQVSAQGNTNHQVPRPDQRETMLVRTNTLIPAITDQDWQSHIQNETNNSAGRRCQGHSYMSPLIGKAAPGGRCWWKTAGSHLSADVTSPRRLAGEHKPRTPQKNLSRQQTKPAPLEEGDLTEKYVWMLTPFICTYFFLEQLRNKYGLVLYIEWFGTCSLKTD